MNNYIHLKKKIITIFNYKLNNQDQYVEPNYDNNYPPDYAPMPNNIPQDGYPNEEDINIIHKNNQ
jgi:hypothetical protein